MTTDKMTTVVEDVVETVLQNKRVEIAMRGRPHSKEDEQRIRGEVESQPLLPDRTSCRLAEDLDFDSLDVLECVMAVEDELDIDIVDQSTEQYATVGDLLEAAYGGYRLSLENGCFLPTNVV